MHEGTRMKMDIISKDDDHIIVRADGPARFEMNVINGRLMLSGYDGFKVDLEQEPVIVYDGIERDNVPQDLRIRRGR